MKGILGIGIKQTDYSSADIQAVDSRNLPGGQLPIRLPSDNSELAQYVQKPKT
jgi:hypothetical protein